MSASSSVAVWLCRLPGHVTDLSLPTQAPVKTPCASVVVSYGPGNHPCLFGIPDCLGPPVSSPGTTGHPCPLPGLKGPDSQVEYLVVGGPCPPQHQVISRRLPPAAVRPSGTPIDSQWPIPVSPRAWGLVLPLKTSQSRTQSQVSQGAPRNNQSQL